MRALGAVVGSVLAVSLLAGIVWYARYSAAAQEAAREAEKAKEAAEFKRQHEENMIKRAEAESSAHDPEPAPPLSETGPYPKAKTGERVYEFGTMAKDEERSHKFTIRNDGEVPLLLSKGPTTCKCTISDLPKREVAPGETVDVEISWTPRDLDQQFRKEARIQTNDPDNREIKFLISGKVVEEFIVTPSYEWNMGSVGEGASAEVAGTITSPLFDSFKILDIENPEPLLTIDTAPLPPERLNALKVKSGYQLTTRLAPGMAVGPFQRKLKIRTDIRGETIITVLVKAYRPGPIRFLPASGGHWAGEFMSLSMGRFAASEGKTVYLPFFAQGMDEEFKLLDVSTDVDALRVTLDEGDTAAPPSKRTYRLKFEMPAGKVPMSLTSNSPGHVHLKTNHPQAGEIDMDVVFVSF